MKLGRRQQLLGKTGMTSARLVEAVETDLIALRDLVQGALRELLKLSGDTDPWPYAIALYADSVIVECEGKLSRYPYTIAGTAVQFGQPTEVVRAYLPAADAVPPTPIAAAPASAANAVLIEAVGDEGARSNSYRVRVIRAGRSLNGNYYPDALLREAAPLFEGVRVFVKSDRDHITGAGKDVRNLLGALEQPKFIEGATPDSGEIQAVLTLIVGDDDPTAVQLREAVAKGLSHLFGLSIDADGTANGPKGNRVAKSLSKVKSVDLIVEPGAGGQVISFVEAADNGASMDRAALITLIQGANPALLEGKDLTTITDEALQAILTEALKKTAAAAAAPAATPANLTEAVGNQFRMRDLVTGSKLPAAAKQKLISEFTMQVNFTEAVVTQRIQDEAKYLSQSLGNAGGQVADLGDVSFIEGGEGRPEKMDAMFDAFFDPAHKDHRHARSFKECYIEITGDRRVTGQTEKCVRLTEALDSTSFSNVLGNAITRRLLADYNSQSNLDIWKLVTGTPVPISDFRTQERVRYGGYGDLPAVVEANPYVALASPDDDKATYAVTKRGGLETITLEMIKNDDVGAIARIPTKLSRAAKRTLCKFVLDFLRSNPAIGDGKALFHVDHANLGTAALAAASWAAARLAMMKQTEPGSLEPLGIGPKNLFVSADGEETAYNLFQRSTNLDKTFVQTLTPTIVPVFYWTDPNDWVATADPLDIPIIELGFLDGNEEPELFIQDSPTNGSLFSNDQITYKIRHIYGGNAVDYRGAYKSVVA